MSNQSTNQIAEQITQILRQRTLCGSDRPIDRTTPFGSLGLGLDSLALLQCITAVENEYSVELPDSMWVSHSTLSVDALAQIVHTVQTKAQPSNGANGHTGKVSVRQILNEQGIVPAALATLKRMPNKLSRAVSTQDRFHIIAFNLKTQSLPEVTSTLPLQFRRVEANDLTALTDVWPKVERVEKIRLFHTRLANGFQGYIALTNNQIVGIDWLTSTGDSETGMGIEITLQKGSCYGLDLNEHPQWQGKSIGMSLIAYALREAKQQGFTTQYAVVHADNEKMLSAAIHLLGFTNVGRIVTRRFLGRVESNWELHGQRGSGTSLLL